MPPESSLARPQLLLVGFGHVARRFVRLLDESREALATLGINPVVVGITTARHGRAFDPSGLDAGAIARTIADGGRVGPAVGEPTHEWIARSFGLLRRAADVPLVLVETTTLDVRSGEPAIGHVRAGLDAGAHVISANKGPVAFAYRELTRAADAAGVSFLFEGAVMDGIPVFSVVRDALPAATIRAFRGVVNSTTNHILTAMEQGEAFEAALARMQAAGVAEADPSLDVDGWDAAAKTAALANVWFDAGTTPQAIPRDAIGPGIAGRVRAAKTAGRRLKIVARGARAAHGVECAVELMELPGDDPLAILEGQGNAIEIDTWPLGRIVITQRDGGLEKTAYALVSDLVTIAARVRAAHGPAAQGRP